MKEGKKVKEKCRHVVVTAADQNPHAEICDGGYLTT